MSPGDVQRRFDGAADTFDSADFALATTREGLLARLEPVTIDASYVVDLGSATGSAGRALERRFRRARILAVDLSQNMLQKARSKRSWLSKTAFLQADAATLPFIDHSIDVVFANQLLPWMLDSAPIFAEVSRVLRKDGLFMFATLGPDSLRGLRHEAFADMHDVGDALVRAGLRDPVLDVDRLTVTYKNTGSLLADFRAIGAHHCVPHDIEEMGPGFDLELELVYGHCWGSGQLSAGGEYRVDAGQIGKRSR
jgi:malonyl-CoA O-methyltransferase